MEFRLTKRERARVETVFGKIPIYEKKRMIALAGGSTIVIILTGARRED